MIHWNGPLNPLPNLCRQQLWHCISSQALHHPPRPLGPLHTFSLSSSHPACCQYPWVPQHHPAAPGCQLTALLQGSARATAPGAAGLGREVEKGALQQSAMTQGTAALCKAPSSTLQRGGNAGPLPWHGGQHICGSGGRSDGFLWAQASGSHRQANWG